MNCGTGEDAIWMAARGIEVFASDISAGMLKVAHAKVAAARQPASVHLQRLAWEDLAQLEVPPLDGALSNFGGLNCVVDLGAAAQALASKLRPGAVSILCIMGPAVPWEWLWYLFRGEPDRAFRRLRRAGASWSGLQIRYPSIAAARRAFAGDFKFLRVAALGALLPPPYAERLAVRYPQMIAALDRVERRYEAMWPLPWLADHYVMELERR
jgi:SAM-dependent methyltransferase